MSSGVDKINSDPGHRVCEGDVSSHIFKYLSPIEVKSLERCSKNVKSSIQKKYYEYHRSRIEQRLETFLNEPTHEQVYLLEVLLALNESKLFDETISLIKSNANPLKFDLLALRRAKSANKIIRDTVSPIYFERFTNFIGQNIQNLSNHLERNNEKSAVPVSDTIRFMKNLLVLKKEWVCGNAVRLIRYSANDGYIKKFVQELGNLMAMSFAHDQESFNFYDVIFEEWHKYDNRLNIFCQELVNILFNNIHDTKEDLLENYVKVLVHIWSKLLRVRSGYGFIFKPIFSEHPIPRDSKKLKAILKGIIEYGPNNVIKDAIVRSNQENPEKTREILEQLFPELASNAEFDILFRNSLPEKFSSNYWRYSNALKKFIELVISQTRL